MKELEYNIDESRRVYFVVGNGKADDFSILQANFIALLINLEINCFTLKIFLLYHLTAELILIKMARSS